MLYMKTSNMKCCLTSLLIEVLFQYFSYKLQHLCMHIYQLHHIKYKVKYTDIAKFAGHLPHRYGNSRVVWDHTVLPATRHR